MTTMLSGNQLILRPLQVADAQALTAILNTPDVAIWWEGYDYDRVLDEIVAEGDGESFGIFTEDQPEVLLGMIQYYEQDDPDYLHAGIDIFVDPARYGHGIGQRAILLLVKHLIDDLGHHRIIIDPAVNNERAIAVFQKVGFREVGVMRRYERRADGNWGDNVLLELLDTDLAG
ncbi:MAG: GNAT family protein [Acidimicrobiia bacterium]